VAAAGYGLQELGWVSDYYEIIRNLNWDVMLPAIKQCTILIVDDEPANIKLLKRMLGMDGYTNIVTTDDPRQASSLYQQYQCDLVLLDIRMPHMNGFEVLAELKRLSTDPPLVVVLTAQTSYEYRLRALTDGARDFIGKPFDRAELLARVANMLEMHLLQKQVREHNQILEQKVRERTAELYDTRLEIVRRLGRAAEFRDNETGMHIIRMSKISALIGQDYGLDLEQCEMLLNASPMHDIGKIGIPDHVLLKPDKLSPDEWEVMKTHARIGADILAGHESELLDMARIIALTHHEKWDGSGYPQGLAGEAIPLPGRIVALADVFDALTSVRPYKQAWRIEEAVKLIDENRGRHFDPQLVDVFMQSLDDIVEIKKQYADPDDT
jgi:putative two-component system response regulator